MVKNLKLTYSSENASCIGEVLKLLSLPSDLLPGSSSSPLSNLNDIFAASKKITILKSLLELKIHI